MHTSTETGREGEGRETHTETEREREREREREKKKKRKRKRRKRRREVGTGRRGREGEMHRYMRPQGMKLNIAIAHAGRMADAHVLHIHAVQRGRTCCTSASLWLTGAGLLCGDAVGGCPSHQTPQPWQCATSDHQSLDTADATDH
jgi:hypothetical protein